MPIVNADVKGLEVVVAAELSGDRVLSQEIIDLVDFHEENRRAFNLGGKSFVEGESKEDATARKAGRLVAKTLKFRTIYGGSAYSFAHDPSMSHVSNKESFWQGILDAYFTKYSGLKEWHKRLVLEAQTNGKIEVFTGRVFPITPDYTKREPWPLTVIKNYPVQGTGADLVMLARLEARRRLKEAAIEADLISTIHDSIVADCPTRNIDAVGRILFDSIEAVPALCKKVFDYDFKLPLTSEVQFGPNKRDMTDLKFN